MNSHEIVIHRNLFYRTLAVYQSILMLAIFTGIAMSALLIRQITRDHAQPTYFMTDKFGVALPEYPLTDPVYPSEQVEQWTAIKLNNLLSINFATHDTILNAAAAYFDPIGYIQYITALKQSRLIEALEFHKYVAVLDIVEPLKVTSTMLVNGGKVHAWILKGKYNVNYFNNKNIKNPFIQELDLTIIVRRENFSLYQDGVSIMLIIA